MGWGALPVDPYLLRVVEAASVDLVARQRLRTRVRLSVVYGESPPPHPAVEAHPRAIPADIPRGIEWRPHEGSMGARRAVARSPRRPGVGAGESSRAEGGDGAGDAAARGFSSRRFRCGLHFRLRGDPGAVRPARLR